MQFLRRWLLLALVPLVALIANGCVKSTAIQGGHKPFEMEAVDECLVLIADMSGSFSESWDDRAYTLFLELMDRFFQEGMGSESRVVLGQLSGSDKVILFQGTPAELRRRFRSPEDLNNFLRENSDPSRSAVFDATGKTVDYIRSMQGVTEKTRVLTVILSDMVESESNQTTRSQSGHRMLNSLKRYKEQGGTLALYFVALDEMPRWRQILEMAGFEPGQYVIENAIVAKPELPRFD
ncbi:hypothetical protein [Lignipirellula cremea]|uniref:VWFA domain-containing protein n=1 Tax=Lignipirellula cremea TaxID=2528010 RepID=A0A518E3H6_9BACT|nr:hypothetical protein [Lignipirellula cremea]QDU98622.1 hypothetical protein Pla8534_64930 [Lignipirellula cremea]